MVDDKRENVLQRFLSNVTFMASPAMACRVPVLLQNVSSQLLLWLKNKLPLYQQGFHRLLTEVSIPPGPAVVQSQINT